MDEQTRSILDACLAILGGARDFDTRQVPWNATTSRVVEAPWLASVLAERQPRHVFDIGLSLSSLDTLGLLLAYAAMPGRSLEAVDIILPAQVRRRYPEAWWEAIAAINVHVRDIREFVPEGRKYDLVTCISVIEHIGFDKPSRNDPHSAFDRALTADEVAMARPADTDARVMAKARELLVDGGTLAITVPMGRGSPMLLRDSLGYYCAQQVYGPKDWRSLVSAPGFSLEKELFFKVDESLAWCRTDFPEELEELDSVPLSHARGVGLGVLSKVF